MYEMIFVSLTQIHGNKVDLFIGGRIRRLGSTTPAALFPSVCDRPATRLLRFSAHKKANLQSTGDLSFCFVYAPILMLLTAASVTTVCCVYINWMDILFCLPAFILSHAAAYTHTPINFYSFTNQHSLNRRNLLCNFFSSYFLTLLV